MFNYWQPSYEGGWATNAQLSRPHIAFGDSRGNVLIVDQGSSSVLKVTPEGRIYTYAGTHIAGNNGDGPDYATNLNLNFPNGGWLRADNTFFVLDTDNGKVRKIQTNGIMSTLFTTSPLGHDAIALLICAAVAPGFSVAQVVVRTGMPPDTPAWLQLILRLASMTVCACEDVERPSNKANANRSDSFHLISFSP